MHGSDMMQLNIRFLRCYWDSKLFTHHHVTTQLLLCNKHFMTPGALSPRETIFWQVLGLSWPYRNQLTGYGYKVIKLQETLTLTLRFCYTWSQITNSTINLPRSSLIFFASPSVCWFGSSSRLAKIWSVRQKCICALVTSSWLCCKSATGTFSKITLLSVVANYRQRDSVRSLWVGAVDLCLIGLRWIQSRSLNIRQRHNVVADLLHLRPVDDAG